MSENKALGPEIPVATGQITVICGRWGERERNKRRDRKGGGNGRKRNLKSVGAGAERIEKWQRKRKEGCINRSCFQLITAATLIHQ